jgi:transcriptional regulator with XRE-family HTH domain
MKSALKTLRKRAGISQGELARRANVSQQAISFVEDGLPGMGLKATKRVAKELGVDGLALFVEERSRAYKRCKAEGDIAGAISHARALVSAIGDADPDGADALVDDVVALVRGGGAATKAAGGYPTPEEFIAAAEAGDNRDVYGRRFAPDPLDTQINGYDYPGSPAFEPEPTVDAVDAELPSGPFVLSKDDLFADDPGDEPGDLEERDYFGRVVRPEEPESAFEDEEDDDDLRDAFGRAMRKPGRR